MGFSNGRIRGYKDIETAYLGPMFDMDQKYGDRIAPPGSTTRPGLSASSLKASGVSTNGSYSYFINNKIVTLWTDFETFPDHPMVLVQRINSSSFDHNSPNEFNISDLSSATTTAPSRTAKLSDTDINIINATGKIRWHVLASAQIFYQIQGNWISNSGDVAGVFNTCSYANNSYSGYATPSNNPNWQPSFGSYNGGCGGGQDASGNWMILSGIGNANSPSYSGGYVGPSTFISSAPSEYVTSTSTGWSMPGYVFLEW